MTETKRPNVTGKGPSLVREMLGVFEEITNDLGGFSGETAHLLKTTLQTKAQTIEPLTKRPFMKTVKAGEMSWDCKEMALALQTAIKEGDESGALDQTQKLSGELDELVNRIQTFVVRMT